jgi:hypothetical protein
MIFGILNIGFGVFGVAGLLTQNAVGSFGSLANQSPVPWIQQIVGFLEELYKTPVYILWRDISVPLEGVASLVLLLAGVGLLRVKNWARLASIGYAVYAVIFFIANVIVLWLATSRQLQQAYRSVSAAVVALGVAILVTCVGLTLAYPALLFFFMTRPKVVAAFQPPSPSPSPPLSAP